MCMKTECEKCSKPTWKGCGKHIEQALKDVPEDERCKCPRDSCESIKAAADKKIEETKVETTANSDVKLEAAKVETATDNNVKTEETKEKED